MSEFIVTSDFLGYNGALAAARARGLTVLSEFPEIYMFTVQADSQHDLIGIPAYSISCNDLHGCRIVPWEFEARGHTVQETISLRESLDESNLTPGGDPGVRVAFIGTGIDDDTVQGPIEHINLTNEDRDRFGHETAIAGIARAIAPRATFIDIHALVNGEAKADAILAGIVEAYRAHAKIVNVSLGSNDPASLNDPVTIAIDRLSTRDMVFVIAGGNSGPAPGSVEAPAGSQFGVVVGSVNSNMRPSGFSGRGPDANGRIRPDLTAPGGDLDQGIAVPTVGVMGKKPGVRGTSFSAGYVTGYLAQNAALLDSPSPPWMAAQTLLRLSGSGLARREFKTNDLGFGWLDGSKLANAREQIKRWGIRTLWPAY